MSSDSEPPRRDLVQGRAEIAGCKLVRRLGEGAFGEIHLGIKTGHDVYVALKLVDLAEPGAANGEALIHKKISQKGHDNVVRLLHYSVDEGNKISQMILEYCDGGELFDRIVPDVGVSSPGVARFYYRQLINGLDFIHSLGIAHRDIKPENLFLTKQEILKIGDFGFATLFRYEKKERLLVSVCGTEPYASPQVFTGKYNGPKADIWSSGIVLHAMLTGQLPWERASWKRKSFCFWLEKALLPMWQQLEAGALDFLRKVLCENEAERITMDELRTEQWYNRYVEHPHQFLKTRKNLYSGISQPVFADRASLPSPRIAFSQDRVDLISQEYNPKMNPLENLVHRMTRFCTNTSLPVFVQHLHNVCANAGFSLVARNAREFQIVDHKRCVKLALTIFELSVDGEKRHLIDFRRSRGDGIQFRRIFDELRKELESLICVVTTTCFEVNSLKICE